MSSWLYVIILSLVQGITEFLPVSSSGHLALLGNLFGFSEDRSLTLGIVLHAGSLVAIAAFYWKTICGFFSFSKPKIRLLLLLLLASVPAGIAGIFLKKSGWGDELFGNMGVVGLGFLITATILRIAEKPQLIVAAKGEDAGTSPQKLEGITVRQSLIVGISQMFAILPGISRSGSTISAGILCHVERESAAAFSFLMAIVAIGGAAFLELVSLLGKNVPETASDGIGGMHFLIGFLLSSLVSFGALTFLVKLIKKGKLSWFSWYLYFLGGAVLLWQLLSRR